MTIEIFSTIWSLSVCSVVLSIVEMLALQSFATFFFRIGIPVQKHTISIDTQNLVFQQKQSITKAEGKFLFTPDKSIYFISRVFWFAPFRLNTPFPFKMVGEIRPDNKIDITARIPIGPTFFILFWLIGWIVGDIGTSVFGYAVFGAIVTISYIVEKQRMFTMVQELKSCLKN